MEAGADVARDFAVTPNSDDSDDDARITLFEDFSGEVVNGSKHIGFTYNLTEPGVDKLLFEDGMILFQNGTVLLE